MRQDIPGCFLNYQTQIDAILMLSTFSYRNKTLEVEEKSVKGTRGRHLVLRVFGFLYKSGLRIPSFIQLFAEVLSSVWQQET